MTSPLGRLERVPLRTQWSREDSEFTPWLAEEENLELLGETLGMNLELVRREQPVGAYSADLLCTNTDDGTQVVVENQIEKTDHSHLGQVVTYAAGLGVSTVVWIAQKFTEDHRAAIDWLNEISHDDFRFFGLEVELWRIGESSIAPKLNVVAKPNDWSRSVRESVAGPITEMQSLRLAFWAAFLNHLQEKDGVLNGRRKPSKEPWMTWSIGRTGYALYAPVGFRDGYIGAELMVEKDHEKFRLLRSHRAAIEADLGQPLNWDYDPNRKSCYARLRRNDVDPTDREQWPELHEWLRRQLEELNRVFAPLVKQIEHLRLPEAEELEEGQPGT